MKKVFSYWIRGGVTHERRPGMEHWVMDQVLKAVEEADVLIFLLDGKEGLTPLDQDIHRMLCKKGRPLFYAVNKMDTKNSETNFSDFYRLGNVTLFPLSAEHGHGVGDLMEALLPHVEPDEKIEIKPVAKIAVLGRPNTGKSTLINTLLDEERLVTSDVPGTTRDSIDTQVIHKRETFLFIDTAGIRKRSKVKGDVEYFSVNRAIQSLKKCDVAILLLEAVEGITDQDTKIANSIQAEGKGCLLVLNKTDLISDFKTFKREKTQWIKRHFSFLAFAPVLFISGKKGMGIKFLFQHIHRVMKEYEKRVGTADLNRVFEKLVFHYPHPLYKGKEVKFYFMTQVGIKPPSFVVFLKRKEGIKPSYMRYLESGIRKSFSFEGAPLRIFLRERS